MLSLDKYGDLCGGESVPNVGADLLAAQEAGCFEGLPADRLMAVLELLRHKEISIAQAATFAEVSEETLIQLMGRVQVSAEQ